MLQNTALLQAFPIHVDIPLQVSHMIFNMAPWGTPIISGLRGKDEAQVDQFILGYEWPIPLWSQKTLTTPEKEELHLSRFCSDYAIAQGSEHYQNITVGANPPDFVCSLSNGHSVKVDCTQFAIEERRKALQRFEKLRSRILEQKDRFSNLRGFMIYVWYGWHENRQSVSLPHHKNEEIAVDTLLEALAQHVSDKNSFMVPNGNLPEQMSNFGLIRTKQGAAFYAVPFTTAVPATDFFNQKGFELGLAYTSRHQKEMVLDELLRVIKKHDKPQIDHLVISSGAPNERGLIYPSEDLLIEFSVEHGVPNLAPQHLKKIFLHLWSIGRIVQIWPTPQFFSPLYPAGYRPASYNIRTG